MSTALLKCVILPIDPVCPSLVVALNNLRLNRRHHLLYTRVMCARIFFSFVFFFFFFFIAFFFAQCNIVCCTAQLLHGGWLAINIVESFLAHRALVYKVVLGISLWGFLFIWFVFSSHAVCCSCRVIKKKRLAQTKSSKSIAYSAGICTWIIKRYDVGELKRGGGIDVSIGNKALLEKGGGRLYYHFQSSYLRIKKTNSFILFIGQTANKWYPTDWFGRPGEWIFLN